MLEKTLNKFTLLQSLAIMIAVSLIVPIPILLGVYVHSTYKSKQDEFIVVSTKKFELSSEIFTESLWNFYPELAQTIVTQLSLDKNFVSVTLKDSHGIDFLSKVNQKTTKEDELFILRKKLVRNDNDIGTVEMVFRKENLLESITSDLFLFGTLVILQVILIMMVISFIYYTKVVKPMQRLLYHSQKLAKKELDEQFIWNGKDEINYLGRALDKTRISLNELFSSLIMQNATLDEKVKQRTKELEETSKYKSEFLANMSHEIRTPMNAIVGMCHLIGKTALNDIQSNYIVKIKDASSVLIRIINDILDFSKIEAGKLDIEHIAFDMHKELRKSTSIFSILAKEKDIDLGADFVHTHRFFRGDPYRIVQILDNFLSNAIKFTRHGSVRLYVDEYKVDKDTSKLIFSVKDSGVGIPKEKQDKLFQAFSQVDSSTTRKHGGTGLGLYISTQLASMMGGQISFESKEGVGSTFSLVLELKKVEGKDVQKENGLEPFKPLNILLIEDDKSSRKTIKEFVRSFGFFITVAKTYEEAKIIVEKQKSKFDLFIIDHDIEGLDGIKTYENLKELANYTPPAILLTSESNSDLKSKAIHSGFERFLVKPINPSFLYDDITALCEIEKTEAILEHSKIDFSDKHVLLVEDNDVNMEVALYLLKDTDAKTDIARNGFEAVERAKKRKYDAILMDIQMPVMDGYEATKIIRKELKYKGPIIAMTANVMAHDIQKCIQVGMDEHIGKPLEVEDFYSTLLKALGKKVQKFNKKKIVDNGLDFDKASAIQRLAGNEELWKKTFCKFYEKYENMISDIHTLIEREEREDLQIYVHSLKGLCGTVGVNNLQEEAFKVEQKLKAGAKISEISYEELFKVAHEVFVTLQKEYDSLCLKIKETVNEECDETALSGLVNDLEEALELSSVSKIKKIIEKLMGYKCLIEKEEFKALLISCETFDFDAALKSVKELKKEL